MATCLCFWPTGQAFLWGAFSSLPPTPMPPRWYAMRPNATIHTRRSPTPATTHDHGPLSGFFKRHHGRRHWWHQGTGGWPPHCTGPAAALVRTRMMFLNQHHGVSVSSVASHSTLPLQQPPTLMHCSTPRSQGSDCQLQPGVLLCRAAVYCVCRHIHTVRCNSVYTRDFARLNNHRRIRHSSHCTS